MKKRKINKRSNENRWKKKFDAQEKSYDMFIEKYCSYDKSSSSHPIFLCSSSEYNIIKDNVILLSNPRIIDGNKPSRKIYYDISSTGKNIRFTKSTNSMQIKLRNSKKNSLFILIHRKYIKDAGKIQINQYTNGSKRQFRTKMCKYAVLLLCTITDNNWKNKSFTFDNHFIKMTKKNYPNQIRNQGMKHFSSEGQIYSIGYAAKYDKIDQKQESFSKYVTSE